MGLFPISMKLNISFYVHCTLPGQYYLVSDLRSSKLLKSNEKICTVLFINANNAGVQFDHSLEFQCNSDFIGQTRPEKLYYAIIKEFSHLLSSLTLKYVTKLHS